MQYKANQTEESFLVFSLRRIPNSAVDASILTALYPSKEY
jgi:hypothetical protein